jgi:hypothetical protein
MRQTFEDYRNVVIKKLRSATIYQKRGDGILELAVDRAMVRPQWGVYFRGSSISRFNPPSTLSFGSL